MLRQGMGHLAPPRAHPAAPGYRFAVSGPQHAAQPRRLVGRGLSRPHRPNAHKQGEPQEPPHAPSPSPAAFGTLLFVTVLWGSYNPVIRVLYEGEHALDPSQLTAIRTVIAASAMLGAITYNNKKKKEQQESGDSPKPQNVRRDLPQQDQANLPLLARTFTGVIPAGIELGMYNFLGTALQAIGLMMTSATRAGFLVQLTAVLVPLLSSLAGVTISNRIWGAASLALVGATLIAFDHPAGQSAVSGGQAEGILALGDLYLIASCCFYSLATVRLGFYAPKHESITLAAVKKVTLGAASLAWLASTAQGGLTAGVPSITTSLSELSFTDWLLITYSALGPGALATYLQTRGQAQVPATLAQVVYSLTPLWSALLAYWILGDEGMGPVAWVGSGAILAASALATISPPGKPAAVLTSVVTPDSSGRGGSGGGPPDDGSDTPPAPRAVVPPVTDNLPVKVNYIQESVVEAAPPPVNVKGDGGARDARGVAHVVTAEPDGKVTVTVTVQGNAAVEETTRVVIESEKHVGYEAVRPSTATHTTTTTSTRTTATGVEPTVEAEAEVVVAEHVDVAAEVQAMPQGFKEVVGQVKPFPAFPAETSAPKAVAASIEVVVPQQAQVQDDVAAVGATESGVVTEAAPAHVGVVAEQQVAAVTEAAPAHVDVVAEQQVAAVTEEPAVTVRVRQFSLPSEAAVASELEEDATTTDAPLSSLDPGYTTNVTELSSFLDSAMTNTGVPTTPGFGFMPKAGKRSKKKRAKGKGNQWLGSHGSELQTSAAVPTWGASLVSRADMSPVRDLGESGSDTERDTSPVGFEGVAAAMQADVAVTEQSETSSLAGTDNSVYETGVPAPDDQLATELAVVAQVAAVEVDAAPDAPPGDVTHQQQVQVNKQSKKKKDKKDRKGKAAAQPVTSDLVEASAGVAPEVVSAPLTSELGTGELPAAQDDTPAAPRDKKAADVRSSRPKVVFESAPAKPRTAAVPVAQDTGLGPIPTDGSWSILAGLEDEAENARVVSELNAEVAAFEQQLQGVLNLAEDAVQSRSDQVASGAGGAVAGPGVMMNDIVSASSLRKGAVVMNQ